MLRSHGTPICVIATCWGRPSIVGKSVNTVVCGTRHILPGTGRGGAEQLVQPNPLEARLRTAHSYTRGNGQTRSSLLTALLPVPWEPCPSWRSRILAGGDRSGFGGCQPSHIAADEATYARHVVALMVGNGNCARFRRR